DRDAGKFGGQDGGCPALVARVPVGVQEADGDRLDTFTTGAARQPAHAGLVQRSVHRSVRQDTFVYFPAAAPGHQGLGKFEEQVVYVVSVLAAYGQHVAHTSGGDERGQRSLALDQSVGDECGAVDDLADDLWTSL